MTRAAMGVVVTALAACAPPESEAPPRNTLVVGIDVSGSFRARYYDDAIDFAANYLYAHIHGLGGLREPTALFVGSVGGESFGEVKSFHPIHDFQDKAVDSIATDLRAWFPPTDDLTDFNAFFDRVATLVKRQGLVLAPLNVVLLTDGVPDLAGRSAPGDSLGPYASLNVEPLEYLSRNVTVRLLYSTPTVAVGWERGVDRRRVRIWTLDAQVMEGWRAQLTAGAPPEQQTRLWTWVSDNVDTPVRSRLF
jgi:hypothetical protein